VLSLEVAGFQLALCDRVQKLLRNMESTAMTTSELKAGRAGPFWDVNVVFRFRGGGKIRLCNQSFSAAARGGSLSASGRHLAVVCAAVFVDNRLDPDGDLVQFRVDVSQPEVQI
jgi:hypothetical protein